MEKMGKETMFKLWFRVRDYLFRLDHTKESLIDSEKHHVDMLEDHYDHCVSSSVTVNAEVYNFKLRLIKPDVLNSSSGDKPWSVRMKNGWRLFLREE